MATLFITYYEDFLIKLLTIVILLIIINIIALEKASAQFLQTDLNLQSELRIAHIQHLNFGTVVSGQGKVGIPPEDFRAGNLTIRTEEELTFIMHVNMPEYLRHEHLGDQIPVELFLAFEHGRSGSTQAPHPVTRISMPVYTERSITSTKLVPDYKLSLILFGNLDVTDIPPGHYTGQVTFTFEY